ncbi:Carboxylesterase, type B [Beauveria brongniartii RCEF 3172]|uniref:Carboxylic ester hydrolase n=1 Tax=Beauveria brongniartii RCEF 3172 TaxID=1081107 RepID=A0A166YDA3_9HYPO|nr:Carboxylesterase, type B [Beauveria brongniartii RCEF 3172]
MRFTVVALALCPVYAIAAPQATENAVAAPRPSEVTVQVPGGSIIGKVTGVESFNGIPYADAPINDLRLRPPRRLTRELGVFNATQPAPGCPQMPPNTTAVLLPPLLGQAATPELWPEDQIKGQEDCLTVNVQRPKGASANDRLPVLFYIFGGGFMFGATNVNDAENFITFAGRQNQKFIFVGVNYRVGGFGFLGGAEVLKDNSTNLGLRDQRMGLEWVADNIAYFGGDPDRVTIWGQSAGSISVFDQMALYGGNANYSGKPLFRGAIMNSGSVIPTERVNSTRAQAIFDAVVAAANCTHTTTTSLECLREAPFETFYRAANSVPRILDNSSLALSYLPRPDDELLMDSPNVLANTGKYYAVPAILTDQEDEGTLFAFAQRHVTSNDSLIDYLKETFFSNATREQVAGLVATYPDKSAAGSPFRTQNRNEWYQNTYGTGIGFKRVAAMLGDFVFTLARRLALDGMAASHPEVPLWSSLSSIAHGVAPYWGTPHGADLNMLFKGIGIPAISTRTYYLNFLYNLNPNVGNAWYAVWPKWTPDSKDMVWITLSGNWGIKDDFRNDSYEFMKNNTEALYF